MSETNFKNTQIIRKDARNCFLETRSDAFEIEKVRMNFVSYDATKPEGKRATNNLPVFIAVEDFLMLHAQIMNGTLANLVAEKKNKGDMKPIYQHLGGKNPEKAKRADNKALSRSVTLTVGRSALFFTAEEGPGEVSGTGIIVPKYAKPDQRVSVSISFDDFVRVVTMTKAHYDAWLAAKYLKEV
jgi:hypothetical protein